MAELFEGMKPNNLWKHFAEFLKIPRCSGNERAIGDYIVSVAKNLDLEWKRDDVGNVIVSKPGSAGHENAEGVVLQGHLDMVCEKNSDVDHDFKKDAIKAHIKGEWVKAEGTTLGADNGIGCCAALAIMEDKSLIHPPLEFLFTVDEETGLTGARKVPTDFLKGRKMLNLDSEDEGEFTIGCAGGADTQIFLPFKREKSIAAEGYIIKLSGLRGGHSGIDINQGRGNAIKLLARVLWQTASSVSYDLVSFEGGNLRNAIPREAWAHVLIDASNREQFSSAAQESFDKIKSEYRALEKDIALNIQKSEEVSPARIPEDVQKNLINILLTLPHGVIAMNPEIEGLVETSNNLAVVRMKDSQAGIVCSTRSSVASALEATREALSALADLANAEVTLEEGYPGWKPDLQSPILKTLKEVYKHTFNTEPKVAAVHAGLECGIIGEKFPGMDMISFGPTIQHPHSPDERIHIGSVEKFWTFLTTVLKELT
ncbi:MAG: aminoacyl-histidine dipeptidase [Candidatus Aminicenantes bacterium]|nr:aminoacyl-histidine dipeptidase [Candidatus Aminicenantes bacterium]